MFCTRCGAPVPDGNAFCTNCGASVDADLAPAPTPDPTQRLQSYDAPGEPTATPQAQPAAQPTQQMPAQSTSAAAASGPTEVKAPAQPATRKRSKAPIAIACALAGVVAAALIVYFVVLPMVNPATPTTTVAVEDTQAAGDNSQSEDEGQNSDQPVQANPATTPKAYIFEDSNSRYLTDAEVRNLSLYDMFIARNEIYARHGRGFTSPELQEYFNGQPWYTRTYDPSNFPESVLNDYERKNADLILSIETEMGSPYLSAGNSASTASSSSSSQVIYENEYFIVEIPAGEDPSWWRVRDYDDRGQSYNSLTAYMIDRDPPGEDNAGGAEIVVSDHPLSKSQSNSRWPFLIGNTTSGLYLYCGTEAGGSGALKSQYNEYGATVIAK